MSHERAGPSGLHEPLLPGIPSTEDGHSLHRHEGDEEGQYGDAHGPVGVLKGVGIILSSGRVLCFLLMSLLMGYGMGSIDSYLFLYLEELGEAYVLSRCM